VPPARAEEDGMPTRLILLPLALLCAASSADALQSRFLDAAKALPAELSLVKTCGTWNEGGRTGFIRMVVADLWDGAGNELYVQWIAAENGQRRLAATLAFPELNDDHGQYAFKTVACREQAGGVAILIEAVFEHDEDGGTREISIELAGVGKYRLTDKTKSP
jgi:hypothetical protein